MKNICLILFFIIIGLGSIHAQTTREEVYATPEKSAGIHYAYPSRDVKSQTPAPKGYKPFYISHFGRHGSRFLISDNDYKIEVCNLLYSTMSHKNYKLPYVSAPGYKPEAK